MTDIILLAIILVVVGIPIAYIRKEKKRGVACVGCPDAEVCARKAGGCGGGCNGCSGCSGCHSETNE